MQLVEQKGKKSKLIEPQRPWDTIKHINIDIGDS